jgi:HSP20 family protein
MKSQTAIEQKTKPTPAKPFIVEGEKLLNRMRELSQIIAHRAFELFEARGGKMHNPLDDWFHAESELLRPLPIEINETEKQLTMRAEVPGFKVEEIKLSVDPKRLIIIGESESTSEEKTGQTIYNERRARQFCRCVTLPAEIDPSGASATLKDGLLEVSLGKVEQKTAANVEVKTR